VSHKDQYGRKTNWKEVRGVRDEGLKKKKEKTQWGKVCIAAEDALKNGGKVRLFIQ